MIEASGKKIGSPVANILTYCYHYDPQTNKHSLIIARVVQLGGMITMAGLGGFIFLMFRRDLKLGRDHDLTKEENGSRVTMHIRPVLWQFLVKWLNTSALFPREASPIAPSSDALYFFLLLITVT